MEGRAGWRTVVCLFAVLAVLAASGQVVATAGTTAIDGSDCAGGDDGVVFRTDAGLEVTHDGRFLRDGPFVNETTLSFPNVTVGAADNASLAVASATERRVCLTDVAPTEASLVVSPSGGPTVVVTDAFDSLTYGAVDYARSETGADLAYSAPRAARLDVHVALQPEQTVQAVDAESRTVLDTGRVTENRTLALQLPGDARSVDLRLAPANPTETATPVENGTASAGDRSGPGSGDTSTDTETPGENASTGQSAGWTAELVDYQPSPQTQHVGGFLPMAVLLWLLALWLLFTRDSRETKWLVLVLLIASVRATSDVLQVVLDGFVGVEASVTALNLLLELSLALSFVRFAAVYSDDAALQTRRAKLALVSVGVLGAASVVTNPIHGFVFADAKVASGPFTYVTATAGLGGWLFFALNSSLFVGGGGVVVRALLRSPDRTAWRPVAVIGSGLCLAVATGVASLLGRGPIPGYDYTASGVNYFVLSTAFVLTAYGLSRFKRKGQESVIADLDDPVVVLDDAWTIVEWNAAAGELLPGVGAGRSLDATLGSSLRRPTVGEPTTEEISVTVDDSRNDDARDPDAAVDDRAGVARNGPPDDEDGDGSAVVTAGSREREKHFVVKATAVTTETNAVIGYAVQFADVTDMKRQAMALESRNETLGRFASAITQDLRTALTEAERYADEAIWHLESAGEPDAVDPSRLFAWFQQIDDALDRVGAVIEDILHHARDSAIDTEPKPVAFERVAESTWGTVAGPDATLTVESNGDVTADPDHLRCVLEQLFRNSIEHGGDDVTVRVGLRDDGFYVADDGPGVSADVRSELFEPGVTTKDDGPGLGLAIAAQRATAHGWQITLESAREGARFVVAGCETTPDPAAPTEVSE